MTQASRPVTDWSTALKNLVVLCVLGGIITFALVLIADQAVGALGGVTMAVSMIAYIGIGVAVLSFLFGVLYIPMVGSVNESLYRTAFISLLAAGVIYRLINTGADWAILSVLVALACLAGINYMVPARIAPAQQWSGPQPQPQTTRVPNQRFGQPSPRDEGQYGL